MSRKNILNNCVFVMDDAGVHNSLTMQNFYTENDLIVQFLSPCSYMLNPIDFGFSKVKSCLRRRLVTGFNGRFLNLVRESANELTESDLRENYRHILWNCVKAVDFEDFG